MRYLTQKKNRPDFLKALYAPLCDRTLGRSTREPQKSKYGKNRPNALLPSTAALPNILVKLSAKPRSSVWHPIEKTNAQGFLRVPT